MKKMKRTVMGIMLAGLVGYSVFDFVRTTYFASGGGGFHDPTNWYCSPWLWGLLAILNVLLSFGCSSLCGGKKGPDTEIADCRASCFGIFAVAMIALYYAWKAACHGSPSP